VPDEAIDRELDGMTGDPALTTSIRDSLTRLRDGAAGPDLAEMARDLLDGKISLRQVTRSGLYTEALLSQSAEAVRALNDLSPEELDQLADDTLTQLHEREQKEQRPDPGQ
jgi:hypothetical protein